MIRYPHTTEREHDVMRLAFEGFSDDEIGVRLGTSARMVRYHRERICERFGFASKTQMTGAYGRWVGRLEAATPSRRRRKAAKPDGQMELVP